MSNATLTTSRDPKGLKFMATVAAAYDKSRLDDKRAQRLNESAEFVQDLSELIERHSVTNQFANEVVRSDYIYPVEYTGPRPIGEQVDILAKVFGLSLGGTSDFIKKVLPTLELPADAEGWFAIPSVEAVANVHFSDVTDPSERYCRAVNLVLDKLAVSRSFCNYRSGQITSNRLRQHARTVQMLASVAKQQKGDILILPCQFGKLHCGESVRRAREIVIFFENEFCLGSFAVGCMALTHPSRFVRWKQLHADCAGDEVSSDADGVFGCAPYFSFHNSRLEFDTYGTDNPYDYYGAVSAFLPQSLQLAN